MTQEVIEVTEREVEIVEIADREVEIIEVIERGPQGPQGVIEDGDIEITDPNNGLILHSQNDSRWRITIDNDGTITVTGL